METVVRPWLGPHHVYGLFNIPEKFVETKGYTLTISARGVLYYCARVGKSLRQSRRVVSVQPGIYLVEQYLPTRVTLWFLINGLLGDLRRPENWGIAFSD